MKKILASALATVLLTSFVSSLVAAEPETIKGEAVCTKCELKETDKCSTAIRVKDGDKTTVYYATQNAVAKAFHKNICQAPAKVTAVGKVHEKDGKKIISLTSIELDK